MHNPLTLYLLLLFVQEEEAQQLVEATHKERADSESELKGYIDKLWAEAQEAKQEKAELGEQLQEK